MRLRLLLGAIAWVAAIPSPASAMDVERLVVGEHGKAYFVEFEAVLDAPAQAVMAVLTDYSRYQSLDPRIAEARVIGEQDGAPLLYTRLRGCLGSWFCREMERIERISQSEGVLVAEAVPGRDDLASGLAETYIKAVGGRSHVRYRNEFEPSFWMPRWLVRKPMLATLESATRRMFASVETRARLGDHP